MVREQKRMTTRRRQPAARVLLSTFSIKVGVPAGVGDGAQEEPAFLCSLDATAAFLSVSL